jgi:uncharacterized protein (TIGR02001 family)
MKKLVHSLVLCGLVSGSAVALAEDSPHTITANVGLYSQYVFRGMTQTDENPALQGGIDYAHSSGFYLGMWGSNVSWLTDGGSYDSGSLEVDFYGGFRGPIGKSDFTYDVGILQYWYPGDVASGWVDADTTEIYGALGWKWLGAKFSYSLSDTFGFEDADGSYYLDLFANVPLGETGLTLGLHYGMQEFDGDANEDFSYDDWKVSLAYDMGKASGVLKGTTLGVAYTDNNADKDDWGDTLTDSQFTVWVSRAF